MVPEPLDLRAASEASSRLPIRSPRQHVAGEAPPELSPLDAFALQSRILARQLGEANPRNGRRVSRLPPLNAKSPLIVQARSDYFRSISNDSIHSDQSNPEEHHSDGLGLRTEVEHPGEERPVSVHPRMSGIPPPVAFVDVPVPPIPREILEREKPSEHKGDTSAFGARRAESPKLMDNPGPTQNAIPTNDTIQVPSTKAVLDPSPTTRDHGAGAPSPERLSRQSEFESLGLAPPRPPYQNRSSSGMSSLETTDEEGPSPMTSSLSSLPPRKLSFNGNPVVAAPQLSPGFPPVMGSPSIGTDAPIHSPRPFNFSRPMSRVSTPAQEYPFPMTPQESSFFPPQADEPGSTPRSVISEAPDIMEDGKAAPSYIYSKFTLPRGKDIRHSLLQPDSQIYNLWDQASSQVRGAPPSPPVRPKTSESQGLPSDHGLRGHSADQSSNVGPAPQPSPNPSLPSTEGGLPYVDEDASRGRTISSQTHDEMRGKTAMSISTQDSRSTIKPSQRPHITPTSISEMTAEQHLAKGIECHESGSLSKSTYHLRLAARQHHPTAMLLYALACRHGWGMRVNEKEGVEWLRKAAEYAGLEIADDEGQQKDGKEVDFLQAKTRKAQFALSIYELGVSHMNGWGIEQDRALALRCFEIASCRFRFR
ncbi:SEL1-like repeat protein [Candidatus Bathyarchaeota archaeon]|nr:SEL1-like repeat protein [Candidatus Bathyarchaeota archaeon]